MAFSFFAGDGQFAEDEATEGVANAASDDPFEVQYAQARVHPYQLLLRDILDAEFAVLYLSEGGVLVPYGAAAGCAPAR